MDLSIIIVSYNTKDLLSRCLFSIYHNAPGVNLEIIVIDNASRDDSIQMLKENFPQVILADNEQNIGFARANNKGLLIARGEFVLFLNPDTVVLPQALEKTLEFLRRTPDAGMVGCKILNPNGSLQYSCRSFPSFWNYFLESFFLYKLFPKNRWIGKFYGTNFSYDHIREVDVVLGAFMMTKKEILDEVGCFDERFYIYSEETDLCFRMKKHNRKVYFFPDAQIVHYGRASASQYPVKMFQQDHRSRFLFMRKHYSAINTLFSTWIIFLGVFLRIIFWGLALGYAFFLKKSFLKNSGIKLKVFVNLFIWYLGLKFAK
jgi:GT2 family glycosyltransferase